MVGCFARWELIEKGKEMDIPEIKTKKIYSQSPSDLLQTLFAQLQEVYGKHYFEEPPHTDLQGAAQAVEKAYSAAIIHIEMMDDGE